MRFRAFVRIGEVDLGRGFAQASPGGVQNLIGMVEIDVIGFAEIRDHIRVCGQPVENDGDVRFGKGTLVEESVVVDAVLAVKPDDAVELHRDGIEHDIHNARRSPRADEQFHAAVAQQTQCLDGRFWNNMCCKAGQCAIDVEESGLNVGRSHELAFHDRMLMPYLIVRMGGCGITGLMAFPAAGTVQSSTSSAQPGAIASILCGMGGCRLYERIKPCDAYRIYVRYTSHGFARGAMLQGATNVLSAAAQRSWWSIWLATTSPMVCAICTSTTHRITAASITSYW